MPITVERSKKILHDRFKLFKIARGRCPIFSSNTYQGSDIFSLKRFLCIIDAGFSKIKLAKNIPHTEIITIGRLKQLQGRGCSDTSKKKTRAGIGPVLD
jgi:hypothetical protein